MYSKWVNDLHNQPFIEMILIPSGYFIMGSNNSGYLLESPEKEVFLHDFYISKYPITNQQFYHFIQESAYSNLDEDFLQHWETQPDGSKSPPNHLLNHPVTHVNWIDCCAFCKTYGLTLPSEAQWEKAARGSDKRIYPWGNNEPDPSCPQCNFHNIFNSTTPVGTFDGTRISYQGVPIQKGSSPYGIEDMAGNVWEWCLDDCDANWLKNIEDNPVDPCNYPKQTRRGLTLDQIKSLPVQYQEAKKQLPFQYTNMCEEAHGTSMMLDTFEPPIATMDTHRLGLTSMACVVATNKEEAGKNHPPFLNTEPYEAVRGMLTSTDAFAHLFAASTPHQIETMTLDCVAASNLQKIENSHIPFLYAVLRGDSSSYYLGYSSNLRIPYRHSSYTGNRTSDFGFRCSS